MHILCYFESRNAEPATNPANPAFKCIYELNTHNEFARRPQLAGPLGIRMQPHLGNINMHNLPIAEINSAGFPMWNHKPPLIHLGLTQFEKQTTAPSIYRSKYLEIRSRFNDHEAIYTDGSKFEERASAAANTNDHTYRCRLPGWRYSIFRY